MGYYGTQYRVRLYPPFGYSILYKEYNLARFNSQKTLLSWVWDFLVLALQIPYMVLMLHYEQGQHHVMAGY